MRYIRWQSEEDGFALTAEAYREFVRANDLGSLVSAQLEDLTTGFRSMIDVSASIRDLVLPANLPDRVRAEIRTAYQQLCETRGSDALDVTVRSPADDGAPAEVSSAGWPTTFLNVSGEDFVIEAARRCYVSLFTNLAIVSRATLPADQDPSLLVGVH